ncbi:hypothetical protein BCR43DRAFT_488581 [Syncephalastrum racemosum]|uniref:Pentacotripeptide-repeat region of PRORP domain-containing protein n=1 Tax=Syncephalastrum racemosum TaxID=13706 RepID=A0A1X2HIY5_SYNRA|nr:hypothetical protein BCR43DRAFT_488581 [Syncephalastrum racemosum]
MLRQTTRISHNVVAYSKKHAQTGAISAWHRQAHTVTNQTLDFMRPETNAPVAAKTLTNQLRQALTQNDQDATWETYVKLKEANHLHYVSAELHSMTLRSFRLQDLQGYGKEARDTMGLRINFVREQMRKNDCALDIRDYNHLLNFYGRTGKIQACYDIWKEMLNQRRSHGPDWHVRPTLHTYNLYMRAMIQAGKPGKAFGVYKSMREHKVKPNAFTYATLIDALGRRGDHEAADRMFKDAFVNEPKPVKPKNKKVQQKRTLRSFLSSEPIPAPELTATQRAATSARLLPKEQTLKPTDGVFSALVDAHGRAGNMSGMSHVFKSMMPSYHVKPTLDIYNKLVKWYCHHDQMEAARRIFYEMDSSAIKPNVSTFNYLMRAQALKHKRAGIAEKIMNTMKQIYNLSPLQSMYRVLIRSHTSKKRESEAERLYREYVAAKQSQNDRLRL